MGEEKITKKELLARYGISYGALYRWKRMKLIPEAWFEHRAAPTGQETVFPRDLICARIEEILGGKDEASLDEMAQRFGAAEADGARLVVLGRGVCVSFRKFWRNISTPKFVSAEPKKTGESIPASTSSRSNGLPAPSRSSTSSMSLSKAS